MDGGTAESYRPAGKKYSGVCGGGIRQDGRAGGTYYHHADTKDAYKRQVCVFAIFIMMLSVFYDIFINSTYRVFLVGDDVYIYYPTYSLSLIHI